MRQLTCIQRLGALVAVLLFVVASRGVGAASLPDFTELVQEYSPAVVNISTTQKAKPQRSPPSESFEMPDLPPDSPFNEFFRRFFGEGEIEEFDAQSLGSGFIISEDGYVISNNHVIRNADEIIVRMSDRREYVAELIGADERSDLALLKIDAQNLPVVQLGTGYKLQVGEWVLAIGSPFGFDHSVTAGIVSQTRRSLPRENYVPFIQTDVAINPGNSGGPLFNLDGAVVGVNSQIFSRTGGFMGLSFAIPIDLAMDVVEQLREKGRVSRGWLGVLIQDVTRELAESFGMEKPEGALVAKVLTDSPAEEAGFQVGDVVLSFNELDVNRSSDLPPIVGRSKVGKRLPVNILRNGESHTLHVVIAELPEEEDIQLATANKPKSASDSRLGVVVADLTAEQREQAQVAENGVLVVEVSEGPAKQAGIRKDDVILMLNNIDVESRESFEELATSLPSGKAISVLVQRRGNPVFLALKTEE